ncbi:hypothetical protein JW756_03945 [Candidatus Woesearchaeota archaeon]|nr:hypothetical protein [Candidatus Woesearchaeota archaeon]
MRIFTKQDNFDNKKKLKPWAKWAIGLTFSVATVVGVNHFTGNPLGLESKVSSSYMISFDGMVESIAKQNGITLPIALKGILATFYYPNESDSKLEQAANGYYAKKSEDKLSRYWVLLNVNGKDVEYPIYFKPGVTDNTYTEIKEIILGKEYAVEGAKVILGFSDKTQSQQPTGSNPTQSLQRVLRF